MEHIDLGFGSLEVVLEDGVSSMILNRPFHRKAFMSPHSAALNPADDVRGGNLYTKRDPDGHIQA